MNWRVTLILIILADFLAFSAYVLYEVGLLGLRQAALASNASLQVLLDLAIACLLISAWMVCDARRRGWNPWPFVVLTLAAGSIGPLLYLIRREWRRTPAQVPSLG